MNSTSQKIAIIGLGFRLPGNMRTLAEVHQALLQKQCMIKKVPDSRFNSTLFTSLFDAKGHSRSFYAGIVDDIYSFDAQAIQIPRKEAEGMDPQQRLVLMMTLDALASANVSLEAFKQTPTGVFIGAASTDMAMSRVDDLASITPYGMTGTNLSIISNRLSHYFDLHGPSMTIDTACSSSMVALNQACTFIQQNPTKMCLAGGVNVLLSPVPFIGFSQAHMLSPDGLCKVFADDANGYVRAEGGAVLLLKSYEQAVADGDHIYATIVKTLVNQDGRTPGISLPSEEAQQQLLADIYQDIDLQRLAYVEAHGTGTKVGDPIETASIGQALGQKIAKQYHRSLLVGSIKSNVGHLETASGMAGIIKAIAVLHYGVIPPCINIKKLNAKIDFTTLGLTPVLSETQLPTVPGLPLVGVNSFGFGGTNAHVILEQSPQTTKTSVVNKPFNAQFCRLTAATLEALQTQATQYQQLLTEANMQEVIATTYYCQPTFAEQLYVQADNFASLQANLDLFVKNPDLVSAKVVHVTKPRTFKKAMFVFSGNGAQYVQMGYDLMQYVPQFKELMCTVDALLQKYQDWSVVAYLAQDKSEWKLADTEIVQPIIFAIELSLYRYLCQQGIVCAGVCGHSVGEIAAACACGVLTDEEGCRVIVSRSRNQAKTVNTGDMAVVKVTSVQLDLLLASYPQVEIAAANTADSYTLSGDKEQLIALVDYCKKQLGVGAKLLNLNYPFHSSLMEPIKDDLIADLSSLTTHPVTKEFYSGVSDLVAVGETLCPNYWWYNIRQEVQFYRAIRHAMQNGYDCFIEIGPRDILLNYIKDIARTLEVDISTFAFTTKLGVKFPQVLATLLSSNLLQDPSALISKAYINRQLVLPLYPFAIKDTQAPRTSAGLKVFNYDYHELLGKLAPLSHDSFINEFDIARKSYLSGHVVMRKVLTPAAALINMALTAVKQVKNPKAYLGLDDLVIMQGTPLNEDEIVEFKTSLVNEELCIESRAFATKVEQGSFEKVVRAHACTVNAMPQGVVLPTDVSGFTQLAVAEFYQCAKNFGIDYQGEFCRVTKLAQQHDTVIVELDNRNPILADREYDEGLPINIFAFDGVLQALFAFMAQAQGQQASLMLPSLIDHLRVYLQGGTQAPSLTAMVKLRRFTAYDAVVDAYVFNKQQLVVALQGIRYLKYANNNEIVAGLFTQHARLLPSSQGVTLATLPQHLAPLAQPQNEEQVALTNSLLIALMVNYIAKLIDVFDQDALVTEIYGTKLELDFNENIAQALLDILVAVGVATKTADYTYRVSSDYLAMDTAEIFNTIVTNDSQAFAVAELICRLGDNLLALINNTVKVEEVISLGHDNICHSYLVQNPALLAIVDALANSIMSTKQVLHVVEISSKGSNLLNFVDKALHDQTLFYTLVCPNEADVAYYKAKYTHLHNVRILEAKTFNTIGSSLHFDLVVNSEPLMFSDAVADVSTSFNIAVQALKPNGQAITITRALAHYDLFIASVIGLAPLTNNLAVQTLNANSYQVNVYTAKTQHSMPVADAKNSLVVSSATNSSTTVTQLYTLVTTAVSDLALQKAITQHNIIFDLRDLSAITTSEAFATLCSELTSCFLKLSVLHGLTFRVVTTDVSQAFAIKQEAKCDAKNLAFAPQNLAYALWCLLRTVRNELSLDILTIATDVSDATCFTQLADLLFANLNTSEATYVNEIICINGQRYTPDFAVAVRKEELGQATATTTDPTQVNYVLNFKKQGNLQSLAFLPQSLPPLQPNEVLVENRATGLNYRDVMWSLGLLPAEALENGFSGQSLGLECSGVVVQCGSAVSSITKGMRVIAFAKNCFATYVIASVDAVYPIPDSMSYTEAASVPVAFLTAYYSLIYQARAEQGERVLIHGGAGGVGLAAIQIALAQGLEVYATAGTTQKRQLLQRIGVQHVYNSRSLAFREEILADTNGQGVDIVLNSLYKDGEIASLQLLKPFGRFIELGKRDFFENNALKLKIFKDNLSFLGVDVDELLVYKPALAKRLLAEIMQKFEDNVYTSIPRTEYSAWQIRQAFADLKASQHIGKLVVSYPAHGSFVPNEVQKQAPVTVDYMPISTKDNEVYVITGGVGGLGSTIASFLAQHGAKKIYLLGRRAQNDAIDAKLQALADTCQVPLVTFKYASVDVTNMQAVASFVSSLQDQQLSVAGFYHAAVQLHDAYIRDLAVKDYASLFNTKVVGACNFIRAFTEYNLIPAYTVFISSITTLFGNEGQANYVAANAYLEALTMQLNQQGFRTSAFLLGPIKGVGLLQDQDRLLTIFEERLGLCALSAEEVAKTIHLHGVQGKVYSLCTLAINALAAIKSLNDSRFARLCADFNITAQIADKSLLDKLKTVSEEAAIELLTKRIQTILAEQLGMDSSKISVTANLAELGIDSLSLMETIAILEKELEIRAGLTGLAGNNSIKAIASFCISRIRQTDSDDTAVVNALKRQHGVKLKDDVLTQVKKL